VLQPLRWGVVGCGKLAADFAAVLALVPGAQLTACCDPIDLSRAKVQNCGLTIQDQGAPAPI
jgi:predicted dehydrogenase